MGLSNFPSAAEGVLPALVMNTVLSVALLKNMVRSLLQVVGATSRSDASSSNLDMEEDPENIINNSSKERRISITQFKSLCHNNRYASSSSSSFEADSSASASSATAAAIGGASGCSTSGGGGSGSGNGSNDSMECCVCLCGFKEEEEVSELSCKHFFHKGCLEKWFDNSHSTCPLCRSIH